MAEKLSSRPGRNIHVPRGNIIIRSLYFYDLCHDLVNNNIKSQHDQFGNILEQKAKVIIIPFTTLVDPNGFIRNVAYQYYGGQFQTQGPVSSKGVRLSKLYDRRILSQILGLMSVSSKA